MSIKGTMQFYNLKLLRITNVFMILILIAIISSQGNLVQAQNYGLGFFGQGTLKDNRTELNLCPNKGFRFDSDFTLSFDLNFPSPNSDRFGYILRVIQNDTVNIDLFNNVNHDNGVYFFNLIVGQQTAEFSFPIQDQSIFQDWVTFHLKFSPETETVSLFASDSLVTSMTMRFQKKDSYRIIFGACDFENFKTRDVPNMNLKNIKIFEGQKLQHHWPLNEISGIEATDEVGRKVASTRNPDWLKPKHEDWIEIFSTKQDGNTQVAVNQADEIVYLIGADNMIAYSIQDNSYEKISYTQSPEFLPGCQAFYNPLDSSIYSYVVDDQSFSSFSLSSRNWKVRTPENKEATIFLHHNKYFSPADTSLYIFGGYGEHKYKSSLQKCSLGINKWDFIDPKGDFFEPRYLAASGGLGDTVYILGGYGSPSGDQMINPKPYQHMMAYSLSTQQFVRKFDFNMQLQDLCFANSMVLNDQARTYYTLAFPLLNDEAYLQLMKGSLDAPDIELVGKKLPYFFHDTKSYSDLFYFPISNKLVAYTSFLEDNLSTSTQLHSLHFPPNTSSENQNRDESNNNRNIFLIIVFMVIGIGSVFFLVVYRKMKKGVKSDLQTEKKDAVSSEGVNDEIVREELKHKSTLLFFGGFQVFDRDGIEITGNFSPLLKELFLIIWLHTLKNNKGISSERLTEILWFDKSPRSAKNNKSVNIAKIRTILKEIGDCTVTHKTGYWKIIGIDKEIYNDYQDFLGITESNTNISKENIQRLIKITEKGAFLFNLNYDWLDEFKASTSESIIETLYSFAKKQQIKEDPILIIQIADCIFNCDNINEEAMILKSKSHFEMGAHSLSKSTYSKFCKDYKKLYGQDYNKSFTDITSKPIDDILTF